MKLFFYFYVTNCFRNKLSKYNAYYLDENEGGGKMKNKKENLIQRDRKEEMNDEDDEEDKEDQ